MGEWSEKLKETTRDVLYNIPAASFTFRPEGCYLKNMDGRFGYITITDAMDEKYNVHVKDSDADTVEEYNTIDALIDAGWVVD